MAPKISVIMAVYNKDAYLAQSIDSILNQTFKDFELICTNSNSTDTCPQILQEYAKKDPRIKVYTTPYTPIPAATKNHGIDRSKGKYVFNLDADDYLNPNTLQNLYDKAKQSDADAVIPDLQAVSENGDNLQPAKAGLNGDRRAILTGQQAVTESLDWTIHAFALWRGDLIRKFRLDEFSVFSDEYSGRVLFFNCRKVAFSEGTYFYRVNPQSITSKINLKTCDRPYTICRLAQFLQEQGFSEKDICSLYFSSFKDCSFLLHQSKALEEYTRLAVEKKIKNVYGQIDMDRVRRSIVTRESGRAEIWKAEGRLKKYYYYVLSFMGWRLFRDFSNLIFLQ